MKNVLTIIKKEFSRFFKDRRMVITILLPGILIFVLYSLLGTFISGLAGGVEEERKYTAYVVAMPENAEVINTLDGLLEINTEITAEEAVQAVKAGTLDLIIIFPENFDGALSGTVSETPDIQIYYNSTNSSSATGYGKVTGALENFKNPAFSINKDLYTDLAEERAFAASLLSSLIPMLMFALLASAGISVAPEAIAGEKERGTMATMLITPIKRWQLALGKILSLACFAMLSGISSFLGVILSLPKLVGGLVSGDMAAFYGVGDYFMLFGLIISIVIVIISAFSVISAFAKSVKESGSLIAPLMIVIILFGMVSMFLSSSPSIGLFAIPILGSGLALSAIMAFTITPLAFTLALLSNLVVSAALIVLLSFMFKSEKIMFNK